MNNFFLTFGLILAASIFIISYYWIKQLFRNQQNKKLKKSIQKKLHIDEKEYLKNYFSYHLPSLIENEIQWIMIWSKSNSSFKSEITYNPIISKINIKADKIESLENHNKELQKIGVSEFETNHENSIFNLLPNSKIITDIIYYIFEYIYQLKEFTNHKIVTSAE